MFGMGLGQLLHKGELYMEQSSYTKYRNEQLEPYVPGEPYCKYIGEETGFANGTFLFFNKDGDVPDGNTPSIITADGKCGYGFWCNGGIMIGQQNYGYFDTYQEYLSYEKERESRNNAWRYIIN